jgi:Xaa-Pro aminopeptidase
MNSATPDPREAVGRSFSMPALQRAGTRSMDAVDRIAEGITVGMTEQQAQTHARETLFKLGMQRIWHPVIVRFGEATLKTFRESSDPARVLAANDIFFIDIGPVWDGHEGDAGKTYVVGDDAEMAACARAAQDLWQQVAKHWRATRVSGQALYAYAAEQADRLGWPLNQDIKGHRVSDFPHAIYRAGDLGDLERIPTPGLWILEIQIAHPTRPFGAFYEDLLA